MTTDDINIKRYNEAQELHRIEMKERLRQRDLEYAKAFPHLAKRKLSKIHRTTTTPYDSDLMRRFY